MPEQRDYAADLAACEAVETKNGYHLPTFLAMAPEAIRWYIRRVQELEEQNRKATEFMDGVRDKARGRNPEGATILDFMACWNEQYQRRIEELEEENNQLRNKLDSIEANAALDRLTGRLFSV